MVPPSWISVLEPLPVQTTRLGAIVELISNRDIDSSPDKVESMTSTLPPTYLVVAAFDNTTLNRNAVYKYFVFLLINIIMILSKRYVEVDFFRPTFTRPIWKMKLLETGVQRKASSSIYIFEVEIYSGLYP